MINPNLWTYCQKLAQRAFSKSTPYKKTFNDTPDAQDVLADLANFCGASDINLKYTKSGALDPVDIAFRAGKLQVFQYICKQLSLTESEKYNLTSRYYEMQVKNQQKGELNL